MRGLDRLAFPSVLLGLACALLVLACGEAERRNHRDGGAQDDFDAMAALDSVAELDAPSVSPAAVSEDASLPQGEDGSTTAPASEDASASSAARDASSQAAVGMDASESGVGGPSDAARDAREPPSQTAVYSVMRYIGAYDHLHIIKRDEARGYCARVSLSFPGGLTVPPTTIEVPPMWSVYTTAVAAPASACEAPGDGAVLMNALPSSGYVRVRKAGPTNAPCSIDIDIELMPTPDATFPARDRLLAQDLAVPCD